MTSLASELLRFELRGARATSVLNEVVAPLSSQRQNVPAPSAPPRSSEAVGNPTVDKDGDISMDTEESQNTTDGTTAKVISDSNEVQYAHLTPTVFHCPLNGATSK